MYATAVSGADEREQLDDFITFNIVQGYFQQFWWQREREKEGKRGREKERKWAVGCLLPRLLSISNWNAITSKQMIHSTSAL